MMTVTVEHTDQIRRGIAGRTRLLIDGEWVDARSGQTFDSLDPATGEVLASVAAGDAADIDLAVRAARRAFDDGPWRRMSPAQRGRILWRVGDLIEEHAEELATIETLDVGKPISASSAVDVPFAAEVFRYFAGWATKLEGATIPLTLQPASTFFAYTQRHPIGVCGGIVPWNFPILMASWKLAPALACGNSMILKPAEQTPLGALRLGELMVEAGIPAGVVSVITGFGETAGAALVGHEGVDKVAFTGSTEVGKLLIHAAAGNVKRLSLELGGKSPNIIFPDAPLDEAVAGAALAIFYNQGEVCNAGSRLFVHSSRYDDVLSGLAETAGKITLGPGLDPASTMGPLVTAQQRDRVHDYVTGALADGAEAVTGGSTHGDAGFFFQPTILTNTRNDMKVVQEEIFGPVVVATPFDDIDDIVRDANGSSFGLAAGVWTKDLSRAHLVAEKLRAGSVYVNCYNVADPALPFGGFRQSGWGRELGKDALELYTETQSVVVGHPA
jgi:phenylacetaldehyde dehydrogenase